MMLLPRKEIRRRKVGLIFRTLFLMLCALIFSGWLSLILCLFGLKVFMIFGIIGFGFALVWISWWLNDKGKLDSSKILIFILVYIGAIMAGFSYYLAYIGRSEIAESLSRAALVELVAPAVIMLLKSLIENLSIYNTWPDKPCKKDEQIPPI